AKLTPAESSARHDALADRILELNLGVWMKSGLALDPASTANYLIRTATDTLPDVMNHTGGMRLRATGAALAGYVGAGDREAINQHFHQAAVGLKNIRTELDAVKSDSRQVGSGVLPALDRAIGAFNAYHESLRAQIL